MSLLDRDLPTLGDKYFRLDRNGQPYAKKSFDVAIPKFQESAAIMAETTGIEEKFS